MRKIRIADIFNTDYGAYRLLRTRVQKINMDDRFENYIVCPPGEWSDKMKSQGLRVVNANLSNSLNPVEIAKEIKELEKVLTEYKTDVVHTHTSKPGATGRIAAKRVGVPLVIHQVHGFYFSGQKGLKKWLFEEAEKFLAKYCDVMLFQNHEEYEYSLNNGSFRKVQLVYIGNGIPFEEFSMYLGKVRKYNTGKKRIACVARLEPVKNHKMLFEAIRYLIDKYNYKDFELNLYGDGEEREKLERNTQLLGIKEFVHFFGNLDRPDMIRELYNSDLSVLTSYKEGKPRALMESSALGVPIVATNVVGTREVVKDGKTGYLVSVDDYMSFAECMYSLLTDPQKWQEFSEDARTVAKKEFDENAIVNKLKELYLSVKFR